MKDINNHSIHVYRRQGALYVTASLPHSAGGFRKLDFVLVVENGWNGLPVALAAAERRAVEARRLTEAQVQFASGTADALVHASGCKTYREFVDGTVGCFLFRFENECVAELWEPNAQADGFTGKDEEFPCDPKMPIEELAPLVRKAIESA